MRIQRERKPENDEAAGQGLLGATVGIMQMVEEVKAGNPAVCQASGPGNSPRAPDSSAHVTVYHWIRMTYGAGMIAPSNGGTPEPAQ